jgi:hypothetical protein
VLDTLILAVPATARSGAVLMDDFFLSTGNAFNDTEPVPSSLPPPPVFAITSITYNPAAQVITLRWRSKPGEIYTIEESNALGGQAVWFPIWTDWPSAGTETDFIVFPSGSPTFYRIVRQ